MKFSLNFNCLISTKDDNKFMLFGQLFDGEMHELDLWCSTFAIKFSFFDFFNFLIFISQIYFLNFLWFFKETFQFCTWTHKKDKKFSFVNKDIFFMNMEKLYGKNLMQILSKFFTFPLPNPLQIKLFRFDNIIWTIW